MFNDERITLEMSKLKKIIIIMSGIIGALFLVYKLFCKTFRNIEFCLYSTEIIIVAASLIIMISSLFVRAEVKDELFYQKKATFYNISFKIMLYTVFISYALAIPATLITADNQALSSNISINLIMIASLFFGYAYLRYKRIYFNYNIIEENASTYYKNVFKNILKMISFFGIVYLVALMMSVFYMTSYSPIALFGSIIIAFISSVLSNGIYYLFISLLERMFIQEEETKQITTPTLILLSMTTIFLVVAMITNFIYYLIATGDVNSANIEFSQTLATLSNYTNYFTELTRFFSVLGITFLVSDLCKGNKELTNKFKILIVGFILLITLEIFYSRTRSIITLTLSDYYIDVKEDFDAFSTAMTNILYISIVIKYLFYIIAIVVIFLKFRKQLKNKKGLIGLFILWGITYIMAIISYIIQSAILMYIFTFGCVAMLAILTLLYLIKEYKTQEKESI